MKRISTMGDLSGRLNRQDDLGPTGSPEPHTLGPGGGTRSGGGTSPVRLAHLTDLHFCTSPQSRYPAGPDVLRHAVARLNDLDLGAVILTGDLFDESERLEDDVPAFSTIMRQLRHPWYAVVGNHDVESARSDLRKEFLIRELGDHGLSASGSPYYEVSLKPGVRLVVLDTTDNGEGAYLSWRGFFSEHQARWLDGVLQAARDEVVLVALHHPPITPFPLMDALKFNEPDRRRLQEVLQGHAHVAALLGGHYHLAGWHPFGLSHVLTGPGLIESPHHFRTLEVRPGDGAIRFNTHTVPVPDHERVIRGSARLRSYVFRRLSQGHSGELTMVEGLWAASS